MEYPIIKVNRIIKKPDNIEDLTIIEIARKYPPLTWMKLFKYADPELELISQILESIEKDGKVFFPLKKDIFKAFELCPRSKIKVVIFGQDPYKQLLPTGKPRAQGLSFSADKNDAIPDSLQHIFKEIKDDVGISNYSHGDLTAWAKQGILLLNIYLTVQPDEKEFHQFWGGFINKAIKDIAQANPNCIYVLWGGHARKLIKLIEGSPPLLTASHPSGLSCNRGFYGCKHFSKINEILRKQGKEEINWEIK